MAFLTPAVIDALSTDADAFRRVYEFVVDGRSCVRTPTDLKVSAPGAMVARVAAGEAMIVGSENAITQGAYHAANDANVDLSVAAADATNPRNDLVIVKIQDAAYSSGPNKQAVAVIVTGTPAGTPADPSLVSHPNNITLARLVVPAGVSAITSGMITDLRPFKPTVQRGTQAFSFAAASAQTGTVTFATPFGAVPIVELTIEIGANFDWAVNITAKSTTSFSWRGFQVNSTTGTNSGVLHWVAYEP